MTTFVVFIHALYILMAIAFAAGVFAVVMDA